MGECTGRIEFSSFLQKEPLTLSGVAKLVETKLDERKRERERALVRVIICRVCFTMMSDELELKLRELSRGELESEFDV